MPLTLLRPRSRTLRRPALALVAALLVVVAAATATAAPSAASSPRQILRATNAERARHGLPPVSLRDDWSSSCARHVGWVLSNGTLAHAETPGTPGYSEEGNWAGTHAILAMGAPWAAGNPWAAAPIHLNQLLAPQLRSIGAWEEDATTCLTTWPGMDLAARTEPRFYSWPGSGTTGVAVSVRASEAPFVPGDFVGLPQGTVTGPNMMVYAAGWDRVGVVSATLRPVGGSPVDVRTVARSHPTVGPYLVPGSAFVIPVKPLLPNTRYRATVRLRSLETGAVRGWAWQFRTGGGADAAATLDVGP